MSPLSTRFPTEMSDAKRALLARRLKGLSSKGEEEVQILPRPADARVRISVDQYRIWLHQSMQPDLPTYNEPVSVFHVGPLDPVLLQRSLEYYVGRHEAWRTGFVTLDDEVVQQVVPSVKIPVVLHDLSGLTAEKREVEDARIAKANAIAPFDLTKPPLFRAVLTRISPNEDRLHLVVHHIAFDGTAMRDSFVPEIAEIYKALAAGHEPMLEPRTLQYPDYALWREEQMHSASMQRSSAFWKEHLAGELPVLRLPIDRPRPPVISQRGGMRRFVLSPELTNQLREMSHRNGATLYMTLLATLHVLLFRYSGQADIIIGTGANGRRLPELQGMMGYMLDTFPVRVRPSALTPFTSFLQEVRTVLFGALGAAETPFDQIVQVSDTRRDPSYHPIFQTFFSFLPPMVDSPAGWEMQPKLVDTGSAKFDLYVEAEEFRDETAACILYNTDLFDAATIDRMVGHWTTMLEAIVADPRTTLGSLPILTAAERQKMLVDWNKTEVPVPVSTMHDLFAEQVKRTPTKVAVKFEKVELTYEQLDDRAERFASLLKEAGAGPGKLVAICIDRSENLLAGLLGILKTGATYLPLDPGTPLSRITLCLEDAEPAVLLTQKSLLEQLPMTGANTLVIEELVSAAAALPEGTRVPIGVVGPEDSAYIIHTSGSTGRPKAVELPHGAVVNLLLSMQRLPGLKPTDVLVAVTTISFDIAVLELFLPIITGAVVIIAPRTTALDPFELSDLIQEVGCTIIQATPATWRALMAIDWPGKPGLKILSGGEALTRDLAQKLMARNVELWNVYGPTETCIWSTARRVQNRLGVVPIGRPLENTTTYILDAAEQPVPIGVAGELYIGGAGLAKGYRGQPELTAEKFVRPAIAKGERIYRTGDYAVYRADGTIECQGRADNQVKVRGYRIELEEVELHLSAYPDVASAAACVWKDETVGNRLAGYVVAKPGLALDSREIRRFLQPRLPEYMIPSQFVVLDSMPLTPNGKTDRKALNIPEEVVVVAPTADEELTEDEQLLAKIWCDVLHVPRVGKSDNFFELGGHSLLLVLMFSRINREFSTNLPITTIFDAQTLMALAQVLRRKVRISSLVPVQTDGTSTPLFMAHSYLLYHGLSSVLGKEQPFYGLRELETDGDMSIEDRAMRYVADMRRVQPHGPYRVAGWCAAGPLAVEVARQLILQGEKVSTLLLFDAWLPDYLLEVQHMERSKSYTGFMKTKLKAYSVKSKNMTMWETVSYIGHVVRRKLRERRDEFYIRHWGAMNRVSRRLAMPLPQFMHNTSLQTFAAMREFQAELLPVKISLIRAKESLHIASASENCGWDRVAGEGVSVLWAPGDHETMFRGTNLKITGSLVQSALNATQSNPNSGR